MDNNLSSLKIDLHLSLNLYLDFSLDLHLAMVYGKFLHLLVFDNSYQIWFLKLLCNVQLGEFLEKYLVFVEVGGHLELVWAVVRELVEIVGA